MSGGYRGFSLAVLILLFLGVNPATVGQGMRTPRQAPPPTWVFFIDKGAATPEKLQAALRSVAATYDPRAVQRRTLRGANAARGGALFDERDLPVVQAYVNAVAATGARIRVISRWVNAVSVEANSEQLGRISQLPCVAAMQPVARAAAIDLARTPNADGRRSRGDDGALSRLDYGRSQSQIAQMNLIALHDAGFTGAGVVIGVLDSGFCLDHEVFNDPDIDVRAQWDFVDGDGDVGGVPCELLYHHGTMVLGLVAAFEPGELVGSAFDASFILCRTEDGAGEYPAEEDYYVAGLEFVESHGGDLATSSLGYINWYKQADLNGRTAVTTQAVNAASGAGVICCTAAGNSGHDDDPSTSALVAPADAFRVITCGGVDEDGETYIRSSDGPSADGRVKPELLARAVHGATVDPSDPHGYTTASGTSGATPLVAGAVACLIQAKPTWTVDQVRERLFETADYYVAHQTYDLSYVRGYGILDAYAAVYNTCSDAGKVELDRTAYGCDSTASILVVDCGLNLDGAVIDSATVTIESDSEPVGEVVQLLETETSSGRFTGSIELRTADAAGVLLIAETDNVVVKYVDADDGQGGIDILRTDTANVDCTPPDVTSVQVVCAAAPYASVAFDTNEPTYGLIEYGTLCSDPDMIASQHGHAVGHSIGLTRLAEGAEHCYRIVVEDEAGNVSIDDNGGLGYTFTPYYMPGDVTHDGEVNLSDLAALLAAYNSCVGDPDYNPDADFDDSGCIDLSDLATLLANYNQGCP
jgi:serine protease AprX